MSTPYALFDHVPLSECKRIVLFCRNYQFSPHRISRMQLTAAWCKAHRDELLTKLAAVTAERDALRCELDTMTGEL